jgi:hypothetical protein
MGFISLQSTQVTAKNSTKIISPDLGIRFGATASVETSRVGVSAGISVDGTTVAKISVCGAAQENKNRSSRNTSKGYFFLTKRLIVTGHNKYRRQDLNKPTLIYQIARVRPARDNAYTHWV